MFHNWGPVVALDRRDVSLLCTRIISSQVAVRKGIDFVMIYQEWRDGWGWEAVGLFSCCWDGQEGFVVFYGVWGNWGRVSQRLCSSSPCLDFVMWISRYMSKDWVTSEYQEGPAPANSTSWLQPRHNSPVLDKVNLTPAVVFYPMAALCCVVNKYRLCYKS